MCEPLLSVLLETAKSGISRSVSVFNLGEEQTAFLELCSFASLPAKYEGCNFSASSLTRVIFWLVCLSASFENSQPPNKQEVVSYCGFDVLSLSGC